MKSDLIVDACSLFARSFFALKNADPTQPRSAVTAVFRTLASIMDPDRTGYEIDRTLFAWDDGQNPEKKRTPKPAEYHEIRSLTEEVLQVALGTRNVTFKDREGDDVAASAATSSSKHRHVVLASGDKDLQQLKSPRIDYWCLNAKASLEKSFIVHKWRVKQPSQVAIALAIIGDTTDNIQGIRGWGPKKCASVFERVTPSMSFSEALEAVVQQIPDELKDQFWDALDRTLLDTLIPVPEPAPLKLCDPDDLLDFDCPDLVRVYAHFCNVHG